MLHQSQSDNHVLTFRSDLLEAAGVPHAFSTRIGGVSKGPFASLNLGNPGNCPVRDADANIAENFSRLLLAANMPGRRLCRVHQVHGRELLILGGAATPPACHPADAIFTADPALALSISTADCVPILLADTHGRFVSAVHAGWRGVIADVLGVAIAAFEQSGIARPDIILAIGPCIGVDAFEVGQDVADQFTHAFGPAAPIRTQFGHKPHVDLRAALVHQALRHGIAPGHIDTADLCTFRDTKLFFSHRRDHGITGRLAAVISPGACP